MPLTVACLSKAIIIIAYFSGFLSMDNIPELLTNFSKKPKKSKKSKHKKQLQLNSDSEASSDDGERRSKKKKGT